MKPGSMVISKFPGVVTTKRRPAVVVSSKVYHQQRSDVILAAITTQIQKATSLTNFVLKDWQSAGLNKPSAVRMFLYSIPKEKAREIGELSERDWIEVQKRLNLSLDLYAQFNSDH